MGLLTLWVSRPKQGHTNIKIKGILIGNISEKDLSKIIKEFEKLLYESYEKKRPKHEPTDSYDYLARQLEKCIMRADAFNQQVYRVRTEMTGTLSHVF